MATNSYGLSSKRIQSPPMTDYQSSHPSLKLQDGPPRNLSSIFSLLIRQLLGRTIDSKESVKNIAYSDDIVIYGRSRQNDQESARNGGQHREDSSDEVQTGGGGGIPPPIPSDMPVERSTT